MTEQAGRRSPFLERVREAIRVRHYSIRTEHTYIGWIRNFILFHGKRHPEQLGAREVAEFLTHLAVVRNVAPATQNQALNALVFLYSKVLERPLEEISGVVRARTRQKLPVVLTREEVRSLIAALTGQYWLIACLQYGSGLRLLESVRLRVKDLDFPHRAVLVHDGKGRKDRVVTLPDELITPLRRHLQWRRNLFEQDQRKGCASVYLPHALAQKYPNAPQEWGWRYVRLSARPRSANRLAATRCATPSPRICWSAARTSVRCRNNSGTRTCARPRSTPTCSSGAAWR